MELATGMVFWLFLLAIRAFFRFLPAPTAWKRGHRQASLIFTLDLLAGDTRLGRALADLWAKSDNVEVRYDSAPAIPSGPPLPAGEQSQMPADFVSAASPLAQPAMAASVIPASRLQPPEATGDGARASWRRRAVAAARIG